MKYFVLIAFLIYGCGESGLNLEIIKENKCTANKPLLKNELTVCFSGFKDEKVRVYKNGSLLKSYTSLDQKGSYSEPKLIIKEADKIHSIKITISNQTFMFENIKFKDFLFFNVIINRTHNKFYAEFTNCIQPPS